MFVKINWRSLLVLVALITLPACGTQKLVFWPLELQTAYVGKRYSTVINVLNNNTPVSQIFLKQGQLPSGLRITNVSTRTNTVKISGIPERAGKYKFTIRALCLRRNMRVQSGQQSFEINVR